MVEQIEKGKKIIVELFLKISSAYNLKIGVCSKVT
jgi:hypothetical protein